MRQWIQELRLDNQISANFFNGFLAELSTHDHHHHNHLNATTDSGSLRASLLGPPTVGQSRWLISSSNGACAGIRGWPGRLEEPRAGWRSSDTRISHSSPSVKIIRSRLLMVAGDDQVVEEIRFGGLEAIASTTSRLTGVYANSPSWRPT